MMELRKIKSKYHRFWALYHYKWLIKHHGKFPENRIGKSFWVLKHLDKYLYHSIRSIL